MSQTIEIPSDLAALLNPQRIKDAFDTLNALRSLNVRLVAPSGGTALSAGKKAIQGDPPNLTLPLPLMLPNSYGVPSGTPKRIAFNADASTTASGSYTQAEVQAINDRLKETRQILAALILDQQKTGVVPTA